MNEREIDTPAVMGTAEDGPSFTIDFESDAPLACPIDGSKPVEGCESCQ